jgi:hypothetical protein
MNPLEAATADVAGDSDAITTLFRRAVVTAPLHPLSLQGHKISVGGRTGLVKKTVKKTGIITIVWDDGHGQAVECDYKSLLNQYAMVGSPGRVAGWGENPIEWENQSGFSAEVIRSLLDITRDFIKAGLKIQNAHSQNADEWINKIATTGPGYNSVSHYLVGVTADRPLVYGTECSKRMSTNFRTTLMLELVHTIWRFMSDTDPAAVEVLVPAQSGVMRLTQAHKNQVRTQML